MLDIVVETRGAETKRTVLKGLRAYTRAKLGGKRPWKSITIAAREGGAIRGGLVGHAWAGWFFIELLWVDETLRGRSIGRTLIAKAEEEARAFGCKHAYVDTLSFQAPGFYKKLGYRMFGTLEDYPGEHKRFWLRKEL